jgi:hypothetical protein
MSINTNDVKINENFFTTDIIIFRRYALIYVTDDFDFVYLYLSYN